MKIDLHLYFLFAALVCLFIYGFYLLFYTKAHIKRSSAEQQRRGRKLLVKYQEGVFYFLTVKFIGLFLVVIPELIAFFIIKTFFAR